MHRFERPVICHVEVGGTLGGSFLALEKYLRYCDPDRFSHEVIFYERPPEVGSRVAGRWSTTSLELSVPSLATKPSAQEGSAREGLRASLKGFPLARDLVSTARAIRRSIRLGPQVSKLASFFQARSCALVDINNHFTYQTATLSAAKRRGIPAVSHYRTIGPITWPDLWLSKNVRCIIPINEACLAHLNNHPFKAPITLVHDIVEDPPSVDPRLILGLREELLRGRADTIVGVVTRLEEDRKGVRELLHAVCLLKADWPKAVFVIVGDGPKAPEYKRAAQEMGLGNQVVFTGYKSNPYPYYMGMDIFVCPSLAEGGPYTVLEAMQCGCAVVSTRVGQVPLWIQNGENGLIVEPGDPAGLASAIGSLLADRSLLKAVSGRAAVSIRHLRVSPEEGAAKLDELFGAVLTVGPSRIVRETSILER